VCLTEKKFENSSGEKGYSPLAHCVNPTWYAGGRLFNTSGLSDE